MSNTRLGDTIQRRGMRGAHGESDTGYRTGEGGKKRVEESKACGWTAWSAVASDGAFGEIMGV